MDNQEYKRFEHLTFDDFRRMAKDDSLSPYEKIGFPNSYRHGKENLIFEDIVQKLSHLSSEGKTVLEIGPGCSELPQMMIDLCKQRSHKLILVDSQEMLARLPDASFIEKIPAYYPNCDGLFSNYPEKIDICLAYSVLHYVFAESNIWEFLDKSLALLAPGGEMLIGDIPNVSMRKRFFVSAAGIRFHQAFTGTSEAPDIAFHEIEHGRIDDAVIFGLLMRSRNAGFDSYVVPQREDLPMTNRREDILIRRP
jgi:hypothetical protein